MFRTYVIQAHAGVRFAAGTEFRGLDADQVRRRRHLLADAGAGAHVARRPVSFKNGERITVEESVVPKARTAEIVDVEVAAEADTDAAAARRARRGKRAKPAPAVPPVEQPDDGDGEPADDAEAPPVEQPDDGDGEPADDAEAPPVEQPDDGDGEPVDDTEPPASGSLV